MQSRLKTLDDLSRGAGAATRVRNGAALAGLGALATMPRRRGADAGAFDQWKLREFVQSLVTAFGYRDDFKGTSTPWRVPYIPLPFAGEMIDYFTKQSSHWLDASVPSEAKQPNFIKNWTARAQEIVGKVERGRVVTPNPDSYEDAPAAVAAKAPNMFKGDVPAGQPHARVLKANATWRLLDALVRLAIHFDALRGQPTKIEIFAEAVQEQATHMAEKSTEALEHIAELPGKLGGISGTALKWVTIAAVGLGALYVVTR